MSLIDPARAMRWFRAGTALLAVPVALLLRRCCACPILGWLCLPCWPPASHTRYAPHLTNAGAGVYVEVGGAPVDDEPSVMELAKLPQVNVALVCMCGALMRSSIHRRARRWLPSEVAMHRAHRPRILQRFHISSRAVCWNSAAPFLFTQTWTVRRQRWDACGRGLVHNLRR